MELAWGFMGHSWVYSGFTGLAEVVGAVLLLWRRTTALGALLLVGVLANVALLNFCYDVQVKLYSCHYLALALILAAPAVRPLIDLLLRGRPATLTIPPEPTVTPRGEGIWRILRRLVTFVRGDARTTAPHPRARRGAPRCPRSSVLPSHPLRRGLMAIGSASRPRGPPASPERCRRPSPSRRAGGPSSSDPTGASRCAWPAITSTTSGPRRSIRRRRP
ncbi:MAG: hypothetical protein R3B09_29070 [Nannocystaceae bacterium]